MGNASDGSYEVIKVREVRTAKGVMTGDVSHVAMFLAIDHE